MAYKNTAAQGLRDTSSVPLPASATGRARMATGFFNAATALLKFAARSIAFSLIELRPVEAHTADDTLTVEESGSVHTTVGASGTVVFTLPAAVVGLEYFFRVGAAQELRIDPNTTQTIALPSTGVQSAAGAYITANADGETVHILCTKVGEWSVMGYTGTWTAV